MSTNQNREEACKHLSKALHISKDAIIGYSRSGIIGYWNIGAELLYGYSSEEAMGRSAGDLIVLEDNQAAFYETLAHLASGHEEVKEFVLKNKDGNKFVVSRRMVCSFDENEEGLIFSFDRDVTEKYKLYRNADRLAEIIEVTSDFVGMCDELGNILMLNEAGRRMVGIKEREDLSKRNISTLHDEESFHLIHREAFPEAAKSGLWTGKTRLLKSDGTLMPVSQVILRHEEDQEVYFSTIIRQNKDTSSAFAQLTLVERESRKNATLLKEVIKHFPQILIVVDSDMKVEFASPDGKTLIQRFSKDGKMPLGLNEIVTTAMKRNRSYLPLDFDGVSELEIADGMSRFYLRRVNVLRDSDEAEVRGAVICLVDVTEFRLLDELKTSLMGAVSHELKNPISGVKMALDLMLEGSLGELAPDQKEMLTSARKDCNRVSNTIKSLLDLTRFEDNQHALNIKQSDLLALVRQSIDDLRPEADNKDVTFEIGIGESPIRLECDDSRVRIVLDNLISNAIKHAPQDSTIRVEVSMDGDNAYVAVADSGPGIPVEFEETIFTRFFRVPGNNQSGTGLGLTIAKQFVEAHGGSLEFRNRKDDDTVVRGAEFSFSLPLSI